MRVPLPLAALAGLAAACSSRQPPAVGVGPTHTPVPLAEAGDVFAQAAALCAADDGRTWGVSLCGPMMVVDPDSRFVVANRSDAQGLLRAEAGVFVGMLPAGENVANTWLVWAGVRWVQLRWPLPRDRGTRGVLVMHESFHRIADQVAIPAVGNLESAHLDTLDGRYYLQLEWRALAAALRATTDEQRRADLAAAIAFRRARTAAFPDGAAAEDALELHEGLAEYTGVVVGLPDPAARIDEALRALGAHVEDPSFVRSFAYATGPALGLLLDRYAPGWRARIAHTRSLADALAGALAVPVPDAAQAAASYGGVALRAAEHDRAVKRERAIERYRKLLVEGAILTLPFVHMKISFDPREVQPIGAPGSVYPTLRVADEWGVLEVTGGALLKPDWSAVVVAAPGMTSTRPIAGDGWTLALAPGWSLEPDARPGDLRVARAAP